MNNDNANNSVSPTQDPATLVQSNEKRIADHTADDKLPAPEHTIDGSLGSTSQNLDTRKGGGHLELLEERPVVNKERLDVGRVTVTKHTRTKTIEVPIELVEEYVTIRTEYNNAESQDLLSGNYDDKDILRHVEPSLDSKAVITINDNQVEIGDAPIELVISRQVATITKDTYAIQEVAINKTVHTHTDSIQVELKHEELDVQEEGFLEHERTRTPNNR